MTTILKGLAEMTSHRDHLRLEVSVLSTLQSLRHVLQVRALQLFTKKQTPMLRAQLDHTARRHQQPVLSAR